MQVCNQSPNLTFFLRFLSSVAWMLISSMDFSILAVFYVDVPMLVDVPVTGRIVAGGTVGANEAANVEGTAVETIGITI